MRRSIVGLIQLTWLSAWPLAMLYHTHPFVPIWLAGALVSLVMLLHEARHAAVHAGPPMRVGGLKDHEAATYLASHCSSFFFKPNQSPDPEFRLRRVSRVLLTGNYFVKYGDGSMRHQECFLTPAYKAEFGYAETFGLEHVVLAGGANDLLSAEPRFLAQVIVRRLPLPKGGISLTKPFPVIAHQA